MRRRVDNARGRLLTLGAGLFAAGALVFTARNFTLSREGQVTDRYTKAIEQLGSDKLDVRIGGIYALERVARDSARDHPTVMEVLTAFIREHSHEQWPPSDPGGREQERSTRPDVQAAVTVIGRRDAKRDIQRIDLTGANLAGADLTGADLSRADLAGADLTGANLSDANLAARTSPARTSPARTSPARPQRRGPHRRGPHRRGPHRREPHRREPHRREPPARTSPARTSPARNLSGANLTGADLTGADLRRGPHRRGPHRRQVARRRASSGGLETGHRLWPTGAGRHWF